MMAFSGLFSSRLKVLSSCVPQPDERMYVAHKIAEHESFTFLHLRVGLLLELDQLELYLPGLFSESGREGKMELSAQLRDITVDDPVAVLK